MGFSPEWLNFAFDLYCFSRQLDLIRAEVERWHQAVAAIGTEGERRAWVNLRRFLRAASTSAGRFGDVIAMR